MRSKLSTAAGRVVRIGLGSSVVAAMALFATCGWLARRPIPGQRYMLFVHLLHTDTIRVLTVFAMFVLMYAVLFAIIVLVLARLSDQGVDRRCGPVGRASAWILASWWRVSLLLLVVWSPLFIMQAPGTSNPDLAMQTIEVLGHRSKLPYPPFDVYPIAHFQIPNDHILLSNQHNVVLTLFYGHALGISMNLFGTFRPGLWFLTVTQALFTLVAFGRAMSLTSARVANVHAKTVALLVLVLVGFPVALWSIAIAKSPLFAASFLWWIALCLDYAMSSQRTRRRRVVEWLLLTLLMLISAKFALYIAAVQIVVLLIARRGWPAWRTVLISLALPLVVFDLSLRSAVAAQLVIPGDPLEGTGLQIQTMALTLEVNPQALSEQDLAKLNRIYDVKELVRLYRPETMAPVRGAGFRDGAYRWREVTPQEVAQFSPIWWDLVRNDPQMVVSGTLLKGYSFFDPFTLGQYNWPTIHDDDGISAVKINGHRLSDDGWNDKNREKLDSVAVDFSSTRWLDLYVASSVRVMLVVLIAAAAIWRRRPAVWVWALPIALQCVILIMSPLNSSGRYALGITYLLPWVILAAVAHRTQKTSQPAVTMEE